MTFKNDALKYSKSLDITGKIDYNNNIHTRASLGDTPYQSTSIYLLKYYLKL
tara:strand:+ start:410 stop:565 length:156 start_codon:yes stop_codon:yes gene_type:complete